jgi:hypothetical protein
LSYYGHGDNDGDDDEQRTDRGNVLVFDKPDKGSLPLACEAHLATRLVLPTASGTLDAGC